MEPQKRGRSRQESCGHAHTHSDRPDLTGRNGILSMQMRRYSAGGVIQTTGEMPATSSVNSRACREYPMFGKRGLVKTP